jgi:hypothetical protein
VVLFSKYRTASRGAASAIMAQVRAILGVGEETIVRVFADDCRESQCSGAQTIILIMSPGQRTRAERIDKPVDSVTRADLNNVLLPRADEQSTSVQTTGAAVAADTGDQTIPATTSRDHSS